MLILRIPPSPKATDAAILAAIRVLKRGGVIAFPTETVYGIGCDPRNAKAVKRIYAIKGRGDTKPLQLIAGSVVQVKKIAAIDAANAKAINRYWPGPLTLLLPVKKGVRCLPRIAPKKLVGIRVTSDAFLRELANRYGHPIAATSANRSGKEPARSGKATVLAFNKEPKPDLLLDRGSVPKRKPTTVARILPAGEVQILRQGGLRLPS